MHENVRKINFDAINSILHFNSLNQTHHQLKGRLCTSVNSRNPVIGAALVSHITHARHMRKTNIYNKVTLT